MIWATVKRKSGQKEANTIAIKNACQYICCVGIVASKIEAMSIAVEPIARIYWAERRGMRYAPKKAANAPPAARVCTSAENESIVYPLIVVFQRKKYQRNMPKNMKDRNTTTRRGRIEGAVKIEMGILGSEVIFDSQSRKARK